jgi:biopolymer transport protein ExbD
VAGGWSTGGDEELIGGVNITPIVDVCLTLLIVFIVTASAIVNRNIPVTVPKAASSEGAPPNVLNVAVLKDGEVWVNGAPSSLDAIPRAVEEARARPGYDGKVAGFVSADVAAPYGRFAEAVDRLRLAGITEIALDTQPIEAPAR